MRSKKLLPLFAAVLMTTSATVPTFSQTHPSSMGMATPEISADKLIDLDIGGAPTNVKDYIHYLQEVTGLNIILMNDRAVDPQRIVVPPIKLRQMPASTAIGLLSDLPGARITVEQKDNAFLVVAHAPDVIVGPGGPVDENGRPIERPITKVFSLEQVLFGVSQFEQSQFQGADRTKILADKVPQMLKLIEEALAIDFEQADATPLIKLHEPTNTLIIRGTPQQLATVDQVLHTFNPPGASDEGKAYASKLQEVEMKADRDRAALMAELQAAREAQSRYVNETASLRAQLEIAEQRLRAAGSGTPGNAEKPAPANQP